jgi:hypothetical protein
MNIDITNLSPDQARELIARLQSLELENEQLREHVSRVPTPVVQIQNNTPDSNGLMGSISPAKIIPRPEKFNGDRSKNKVNEFRRKMKRYLRCIPQLGQAYHVDVISGFLTGAADSWFNRWMLTSGSPTADEVLDALVAHFCPANVSQEARRKIATLKQRTSVSDYADKFRDIMEEIDEIAENEAKNYFINGLKDAVKKEVLLKDLYDDLSLDKVEQIAVQIDSIVFQKIRPGNFNRPSTSANGPSPMEGVQFGRLSLEEQNRFRREDRCFICKRQSKHADGCRSRYVFKSNLDVENAEGREQENEPGDEPDH